jgi:hypothetical protein
LERITYAGSNFLGLTAERLLSSGVDGGAVKGAAYPTSLADWNSRKLAATSHSELERKLCAGSNFLGLTAERLLASRGDGRTIPEAVCLIS